MGYFTTISTAKAKPGKEKELEELFLKVDARAAQIPGLLNAQTFRQQDSPNTYWFVSTWESEEANMLAILENEDLRTLVKQTIPLFETRPEVGIKMDVLSSHGVAF